MSTLTIYPTTVETLLADSEGFIFQVIGSHGDIYIVGYDYVDGWFCPCPDHIYRRRECKHIRACKNELDLNHICVSDDLFCEVTA
ncbi:MAG: hypothetical protein IJQ68_05525 [Methanobrevibacter sp.]|uniref:hypothetical protein n=1 Tax=Methanobrevibacter sp. TaxID=66852 RepID=UPI0025D98E03|nr:hypothetical protein [Methanobrevibacter sp.]MBR0271437.1 hypothetical protein [Methanobrevibacter sp.]